MKGREGSHALWYCSANHAYVHLIELSWPVIAALMKSEYGWGYTITFLFASLPGMAFGFGSFPGGIVADKLGSFKTIFLGNVWAVLMSLLILITNNIYLLAAEFFFLGLAISFYHPAGLNAISSIFKDRRGKAMGFHGFVGSLGQQISPLSVGIVASFWFGWKAITLVWIAVGLPFIVLGYRFVKDDPERETEEKTPERYREAAKTLLKITPLLILFFLTFRGFYYRGFITALPTIYRDLFHLSDLSMSFFTTMFFISALPGHIIGGWTSDRWGSPRSLTFYTTLNVMAAVVIMLAAGNLAVFVVGVCVFGFSFFATQPPVNTMVAEVTMKNVRGLFYGLSFATRFGVAFLGTIAMGVASDVYGLTVIFPLVFLFTLVGLASTLGLGRIISLESKKQTHWEGE